MSTKQNINGGIEKQKDKSHRDINSKLADINLTLVMITLNVNGLDTPIKRQRLTDEDDFRVKDTKRWKVKGQ